MKKLFLTALLAAQGIFATQGKAQEQTSWAEEKFFDAVDDGKVVVVFETFSYRAGDNRNPNPINNNRFNVNPGVGFEYRLSDYFHAGAGVFKNNNWQPSAYLLAGVETNGKKMVGVGAEIGVASFSGVPLVAMPYVRLGSRDGLLNVKINAIPPGPQNPLTFGGQLRWNVGASFKK